MKCPSMSARTSEKRSIGQPAKTPISESLVGKANTAVPGRKYISMPLSPAPLQYRKVPAGERRDDVVLRGADKPRQPRVPAVRADDDGCGFRVRSASAPRAATDARDPIAVRCESLDRITGPYLDARFRRGVDHRHVEDRTPRPVAEGDAVRRRDWYRRAGSLPGPWWRSRPAGSPWRRCGRGDPSEPGVLAHGGG